MAIQWRKRQCANGDSPEAETPVCQKSHHGDACENLNRRFVQAALADASDGRSWLSVWRLLVHDRWYQSQLHARARWVLLASGSSLQWLEDLKHDAILLLARNLKRSPDLHADFVRLNQHFAAWMRGIMTRDCREALLRIRRPYSREHSLVLLEKAVDQREIMEDRIELSVAVDGLSDLERTVISLRLNGLSVPEIAIALRMHTRKVRRTCQRAVQLLQKRLSRVAR